VGSGGDTQPQATALPAPLGLAATFDPRVAFRYGAVMGRETRNVGRNLQEGPDIDMARVPLNGRTFEAYGEDPLLVGKIASAVVQGIQSEGTIGEPKHYVANSQEVDRDTVNELIDERTLRQIYLPGYEMAVVEGRAGGVMCAKNKVNGAQACEHQELLQGVLKDEWGFEGFVVSDFDSCHDTDTPANTPAQYPGLGLVANFSEGLRIGYRHYDARGIEPLFPFGFGLSYTTFRLDDLDVRGRRVSVAVTNTGRRRGSQVVQVYVGGADGSGPDVPPRRLEGFEKVWLDPGERREVEIELGPRAFAHWDAGRDAWVQPAGFYTVHVGTSSRDLPLREWVRRRDAVVP
jgi:hypothetical protein